MGRRAGGRDLRRHPLPQLVAWVTERKDVLSGVFFMLTLAAYLGYAEKGTGTFSGTALGCFSQKVPVPVFARASLTVLACFA